MSQKKAEPDRGVERTGTSIYKLVLVAATRANELAQGSQPLIKTSSKKVSTIALEEIAAGKVRYEAPDETESEKAEK